jgi:hypothetical protein
MFMDDEGEWDDDAELHPRTYGSILSWGQNDQLGALGVLYVILALILVNGKVMQERELIFLSYQLYRDLNFGSQEHCVSN